MKRNGAIIWFLTAFFAVCLTVVSNGQRPDAVSVQSTTPQSSEASVMTPLRQQPHEAMLTDASQLYRICSSRPQRILSTQGSRGERTLTSLSNLIRYYIVKPLHSYFDSRCRLESAPYSSSASCDYYVIALRHIIR